MELQNLFMFIIFTTSLRATLSLDSYLKSCAPRNCGNGPDITYPFWILDQQPPYCGHQNFTITCRDQNPILEISNNYFKVKDIIYEDKSVYLANTAFYEEKTCPTPLHNFTLDHTPFNFSPLHNDVYLFYNCISMPNSDYQVECSASNTELHSFVVLRKDALEATGFETKSCQSLVTTPLDYNSHELKNLLVMNYKEILQTGFNLNWELSNCDKCKNSGGVCGSGDADEFTCFCDDNRRNRESCNDVSDGGLNLTRKLLIGFGAAGASVILMSIIFCIYHRRVTKKYAASSYVSRSEALCYSSSSADLEKMGSYFGLHIFTYLELEEATKNFDPSQELGEGGFGTVYYGKLKDGRDVAVKRLYENNYKIVEQFINEVEILARLRHQNLVSLYGCSPRRSQALLLVYEYIPNGTLADHLHGEKSKPGSLPWSTRLNIAIETASALAYLHASDIIHRDVKTNNILLDNNFRVKVADFGLSRLFPLDVTHISTAPQGTLGYVDPDYHQCYQLTDKSDVYSFGVVLVELISSKLAVDITRQRQEINLSTMAINKIKNHALHELVDANLGFGSDATIEKTVTNVAALAFRCLPNEKDERPNMEEVLKTLKDIRDSEEIVVKPEELETSRDDTVLLMNGSDSSDSVPVK